MLFAYAGAALLLAVLHRPSARATAWRALPFAACLLATAAEAVWQRERRTPTVRGISSTWDPVGRRLAHIPALLMPGDGVVRVASIYLPNGNPVGSEKYPYKLMFMERLILHTRKLMQYEEPLVLAGDFNVIPEPRDAAHPEQWVSDALFLPQTRMKYRELMALGLTDALRATTDAGGLYTFWDYQAGGWQKNNGIRIDHLLLSSQAVDRLRSVAIDKAMRGRDKASDHTPIRVDLAL